MCKATMTSNEVGWLYSAEVMRKVGTGEQVGGAVGMGNGRDRGYCRSEESGLI